ncbi:hypothetical protein DRJ48_01960 [Candidatus Woesearchaeota archaeon]|nr:MAG: hypothetical protein DRJ48_01960 [Candidatus Woesearchaeota archaeon]
MLNIKSKLWLTLLVLLFLPNSTWAILTYSRIVHLDFEPNLTFNYTNRFWGASNITTYIAGNLEPYATLIDPNQGGGPREITVVLRLPENLSRPGKWTLFVGGVEKAPKGYGMTAIPAIEEPIYVYVPYPGYYIDLSLNIPSVEENETVEGNIVIINRGHNNITQMKLDFAVVEEIDNETVYSFTRDLDGVLVTGKTREEPIEFSTSGIPPGDYLAKATVFYHGKTKSARQLFTIGSLDVRLVKFPNQLPTSTISKFVFVLQARWRHTLDVYAVIYIDGRRLATTPTVKMGGFKEAQLETFVDTAGFSEGEHNLSIEVFFGGISKRFNEKILIKAPEAEKPALEGNRSILLIAIITSVAGVVVIGTVLVILLYLIKWRR